MWGNYRRRSRLVTNESGVIGDEVPNPRVGPPERAESDPDGAELVPLDDDRYGLGSTVDDVIVGTTETVGAVTAYHPFAFPEPSMGDDDGFTDAEVERE